MLWYKSWLETRWRFLIGLVLLLLSACSTVFTYPQVVKLLSAVTTPEVSGAIGRRIAETLELSRDYRGYIWAQAIRQNLLQTWSIFAVLLGTGGLLAHGSGGGAMFTLSLPVSRTRVLGVRIATGAVELLILALAPALLFPVLSPAVGQSYRIADAFIYGTSLFLAGGVFFSLATLLSTVFSGIWRPLLIVLCIGMVLGLFDLALRELSPFSLFRLMSAEDYFRGHGFPWLGLFATAAASAAMLYGAALNLARRDF
jgi:ABC-type transport system involved in multi-copper enzyme maturation permease subunit